MTDDRDARVPSPVGSRGSDPELLDLLFSLALAVHRWLVRHRYVLRHNRSALGLTINYIVLMTVPVFPLLIYVHWVATRSFPEGDEIDFKGIVFLLVAVYFFRARYGTPVDALGRFFLSSGTGALGCGRAGSDNGVQDYPGLTPAATVLKGGDKKKGIIYLITPNTLAFPALVSKLLP